MSDLGEAAATSAPPAGRREPLPAAAEALVARQPPAPPLVLLRVVALPIATLEPFAAPAALAALEAARRLEAETSEGALGLEEELYRLVGVGPAAPAAPANIGPDASRRRRGALISLRRDIHNRRRVASSLLAAVQPALPAKLAARLAHHLELRERLAGAEQDYERVFRREVERGRGALLELARTPLFREGVRLVSRALWERLEVMLGSAGGVWRHGERHAGAKLAAYAARFTTKTSPNSVFCATSLVRLAAAEEAFVGGENRLARVDYLLNIAEARKVAACLAQGSPSVRPRPNTTLRLRDGAWTFWRPASPRNESDEEVLCRVGVQPVAEAFLEEVSRDGPEAGELLARVSERTGAGEEDLAAYFEQLVGAGLLIAEIEPPFNERRPLAHVAAALRAGGLPRGEPPRAAGESPLAGWLGEAEAVERCVDRLPALDPVARLRMFDEIESRLDALPHTRELRRDELLRADAATALEVALPAGLIAELAASLRGYARLLSALYPERLLRTAWVDPFLSRYPPDTEVEVLDLYHRLFEAQRRERPASFPNPPDRPAGALAEAAAEAMRRTRELLVARAQAAGPAAGGGEIVLEDRDWDEMAGGAAEPDWAAGVLFQIAAGSAAELAAGRYRLVLSALFSGAGIALARFAHLHGGSDRDSPIARELARSWAPLVRPAAGAVVAEITYTHLGRSANAGLRPLLFRHEIELPGERATPGSEVIPFNDLTVRYDSREDRLVLRSRALGVEVVPVITSGISPDGFVSFLVEVGRQGQQPLAHFPGFDAPDVRYWPRIRCGRLVLFRQRWRFPLAPTMATAAPGPPASGGPERDMTVPPVPPVPNDRGDPEAELAAFFRDVCAWRERQSLPRHVFVHTDAEPKPFYVDLEAPLFVDLLRRALAAQGPEEPQGAAEGPGTAPPRELHVTEMLPGPAELWVEDSRGRYASEFLVHLSKPG